MNQVAHVAGDKDAHLDNAEQLRFVNPDGADQRVLPANNYLQLQTGHERHGLVVWTRCAVTPEGGVRCARRSL